MYNKLEQLLPKKRIQSGPSEKWRGPMKERIRKHIGYKKSEVRSRVDEVSGKGFINIELYQRYFAII
uniref:IENR2 domain-containing protein n=1 Tax=Heterorhabditis bacteriophora TaxID=37862 RepID=A0A1I7XJ69_HETBA